jgi:hypothetical protein
VNAPAHASNPPPRPDLLEANLQALATRSPGAAHRIRQASPNHAITLRIAADGSLTGIGPDGRRLASLHQPKLEAQRLIDTLDVKASATFVVKGFGAGHLVGLLAAKLGWMGALVVFEPDAALLRGVLERIDIVPWIRATNFAIVTDATDTGQMAQALSGIEGVVAAGVKFVDHPSSRPRLAEAGDLGEAFSRALVGVVSAVRTAVVTTLVQVDTTIRNELRNLPVYATSPGIADLKDCCQGVPAVVVAAGPSLHRNIDLLARPGMRERVVIIAVQTVLKQLLAKGVKPHFVCTLDYHQISTRFYEGLTARDVEGVTLVAEARANPATLRAFPGAIRCVADQTLDKVLGEGLRTPNASIPLGATVAHLCYYLARHLGCDPVLLVGQDLAFTDGTYYGPNAAIHQVWSSELNDFTSLEMLEWQRIMRMRTLLKKRTDQSGRPIYTDEQMATYLVQFERDFEHDARGGRTTIDATEGGVAKLHTTPMPLRDALARFASTSRVRLPSTPPPQRDAKRQSALAARLEDLRRQTALASELCTRTLLDLDEMLAHHDDQQRVNALIERVHARARQIGSLDAHWLVQQINQTGQLNRFKADRALAHTEGLSSLERQRGEIERDRVNVSWLKDAASRVDALLDEAQRVLSGGVLTQDEAPVREESEAPQNPDDAPARRRVCALVLADPQWSGLLLPHDLSAPAGGIGPSASPLARTLARLDGCEELDAILIATDQPALVASLLRDVSLRTPCEVTRRDLAPLRARGRSCRASRIWARHCWRAGVGGLSVFDEALCPALAAPLVRERSFDACVPIGADWVMIDPRTVDRVVRRHREQGERLRFAFAPGAPGLACCIIAASLLDELAAAPGLSGTVGRLLNYDPTQPRQDPIAKLPCVNVSPGERDLLLRCCWDDDAFRAVMDDLVAREGLAAWRLPSADLAQRASALLADDAFTRSLLPETIELDLGPVRDEHVAGLAQSLRSLARNRAGPALTIRADARALGPWRSLANAAKAAGVSAVHLRISHEALDARDEDTLIDAMDLGLDAVSIDMAGDDAEAWLRRTGADTLGPTWDAVQRALDERRARDGVRALPSTWLVPRLARTDDTLGEIEGFCDRWMLTCGACAIDPRPEVVPGQRVEPLPLPANVVARRAWSNQSLAAHSARVLLTPSPNALEGAI